MVFHVKLKIVLYQVQNIGAKLTDEAYIVYRQSDYGMLV